MSYLSDSVLVLNKSWRPINTTSVRTAICMVYSQTAKIVDPSNYATYDFDTWRDAAQFAQLAVGELEVKRLQGLGWSMPIPEVIVLSQHNGFRRHRLRVSRRNIFARDNNCCQYCGKHYRTQDLTLDHVMPRSRGGRSSWSNLVVACYRCNQRKGNRTPEESHMKLKRKARRPHSEQVCVREFNQKAPRSWEAFLSEMYWNQELK